MMTGRRLMEVALTRAAAAWVTWGSGGSDCLSAVVLSLLYNRTHSFASSATRGCWGSLP